jgi:hypothetical protein
MGISDRFRRRTDSAPPAGAIGFGRGTLVPVAIALAAAGALTAAALAVGGSAQAAGKPVMPARPVAPDAAATVTTPPPADGYQFVELGSHKVKTYNALFAVNNHGRIAGAYGSGLDGHASKGYTIIAPYAQGDIKSENFPKSAQTEVFGLNDNNVQVGDYSTQNKTSGTDNSFGWYFNGSFHKVVFPTTHNASPTQDFLDGVNNHDVAVGDYKISTNIFRSFTFNIKTGKFSALTLHGVPSSESVAADSINDAGDVVGSVGTEGFLKLAGGAVHLIAVPGAISTLAEGINDNDTVVGFYVDNTGGTITIHGFIWRIGGSLSTDVDDPNSGGETFPYGINNEGDIVGSYVDAKGNTDGFLAFPAF